jgi:hypothetical protein
MNILAAQSSPRPAEGAYRGAFKVRVPEIIHRSLAIEPAETRRVSHRCSRLV